MMSLSLEAHLLQRLSTGLCIICCGKSLALGLLSHQIQNKGPTNVTEHTQQGLVSALQNGALSLSKKEKRSQTEFFLLILTCWVVLQYFPFTRGCKC